MSDILVNPSYLDLLHVADKEIEITQDFHHLWFEGGHIIKRLIII
jgi:hypothetical protein